MKGNCWGQNISSFSWSGFHFSGCGNTLMNNATFCFDLSETKQAVP